MLLVRRIAACAAAILIASAVPARAQDLILPLTGERARPIEASTLFHTLFSDFFSERDRTTYVQTGDIPAMWLRDSSAQTIPYVRFVGAYPVLAVRFAGVIERNARNIIADPYANAFRADYRPWERKWEAGSLAWPFMLAWVYRQQTGSRVIFTPDFHRAMKVAVNTWRCEQLHPHCSSYTEPDTVNTSRAYNANTGMIWSAFRASDDAVRYRFNIPQNAIAVIGLQEIARLALDGYGDRNLSNEAQSIAVDVQRGISRYGRVWEPQYGGWIYVYETDGLGHDLFMDDANIPNLTTLPYLGWCSTFDPTYLNTRKFTLSSRNPYYFSGTYGSGLGSPHTPDGWVWPLGIIGRALTATGAPETLESITTLAETDSSDGLIHESFYPGGYWRFSRAEFGWANALYAELLFRSIAGFTATPFPAYGGTVLPFEHLSQTPTLTRPLAMLRNAGMIFRALGSRLQKADGRTQ